MLETFSPPTSSEEPSIEEYDQNIARFRQESVAEFTEQWRALEPEFREAVELIKQDILDGRWTDVIADDSRGRFPAMVIRGVMSRVYQEQGGGNVPLTFL